MRDILPVAGATTSDVSPKRASFKNLIQFKSFSWLYHQLFEVVRAESDALKEKAFRIRYEVYCSEYGYDEISVKPDQLERDVYDERSSHALLIHKRSGEAIGTMRMILPDIENLERSFALQERFQCGRLRKPEDIAKMGELSRLCVLKKFRSRQGDIGSPLGCVHDQDQETFIDRSTRRIARRLIPFAPIGLIGAAFEMAAEQELDQICAVLELPLIETLEKLGILCMRIGPIVNEMTPRQPVLIDLKSCTTHLYAQQKAVWEVLTDHGRIHDIIHA